MKNRLKPINRNHSITVPTRLLNTPLLVSEDDVNLILSLLNSGNVPNVEALFIDDTPQSIKENQIAVIPVMGGLQYRGYGWFWRMSYSDIRKYFREAMADESVKAVLFDIDSPGGEVNGLFDLVDEIYNARGAKPIYAVANEYALSAAYAIASAADKIYLSRTASVGSIGVIAIHLDQSRFDDDIGVKYTAVYAGRHKNDYTPHEPLKSEARDILQHSVNKTHLLLSETVARNRGMTVEDVLNTEALIYEGADAINIGLADSVMPWDPALEDIISNLSKGGKSIMDLASLKQGLSTFLDEQRADTIAMLSELGFAAQAEQPEPVDFEKLKSETLEAGRKEGLSEGVKQATDKACEVIEICRLADLTDMAGTFIQSDASIEGVRKSVLEEKAKRDGSDQINSTVSALGTGAVNPLVEDAKRRKAARD